MRFIVYILVGLKQAWVIYRMHLGLFHIVSAQGLHGTEAKDR